MKKLIAAAAALAAGAMVVAFLAWDRQGADGPLPVTGGTEVSFEAGIGESVSWGTPLPGVGNARVTLRSIEPVEVQNLEIVGIGICRSDPRPDAAGNITHCAPINAMGWPPSGIDPEPVPGTEVTGSPDPLVDVIIGVRRSGDAADAGVIGSVRIVYEAGGVTYEAVQPWTLRLLPRDAQVGS